MRRRLVAAGLLLGGALLIGAQTSGSAASQSSAMSGPAIRWAGNIGAQRLEVESLADQRARVQLAMPGPERMTIEASAFAVTTTPDGLKVTAVGDATITSSNRPGRSVAESMELSASRAGSITLRASRVTTWK